MAGDDAPRVETVALVALGGFAGSNARYLVDRLLPGLDGTLLVNVLGSLALGFLLAESVGHLLAGRSRLVFAAGFLASFTTYSTFAVETVRAPGVWPLLNVAATYALGFGAVLVGHALARRVGGVRA
jgi:CrcB protein